MSDDTLRPPRRRPERDVGDDRAPVVVLCKACNEIPLGLFGRATTTLAPEHDIVEDVRALWVAQDARSAEGYVPDAGLDAHDG